MTCLASGRSSTRTRPFHARMRACVRVCVPTCPLAYLSTWLRSACLRAFVPALLFARKMFTLSGRSHSKFIFFTSLHPSRFYTNVCNKSGAGSTRKMRKKIEINDCLKNQKKKKKYWFPNYAPHTH